MSRGLSVEEQTKLLLLLLLLLLLCIKDSSGARHHGALKGTNDARYDVHATAALQAAAATASLAPAAPLCVQLPPVASAAAAASTHAASEAQPPATTAVEWTTPHTEWSHLLAKCQFRSPCRRIADCDRPRRRDVEPEDQVGTLRALRCALSRDWGKLNIRRTTTRGKTMRRSLKPFVEQ